MVEDKDGSSINGMSNILVKNNGFVIGLTNKAGKIFLPDQRKCQSLSLTIPESSYYNAGNLDTKVQNFETISVKLQAKKVKAPN